MPRYFFNVTEGHSKNLIRDSEGVILSDDDEARKEAAGWARDIAKHGFCRVIPTRRVVVTRETGDEIMTLRLSDIRISRAAAWLDRTRAVSGYFNSRSFALLLVAALLAIIVHAAAITTPVLEKVSRYAVASAPAQGRFVDVRFMPGATAADITKFLEHHQGSLVDGPRLGGFYRMQISDAALQRKSIEKIAGEMAKENIVEFAAVVE
jgi:hypothetical protein